MSNPIQKIYGDLGELFAVDHLKNNDYQVCRADSIEHIGHSLLTDKDHVFDCTTNMLTQIAKKCKKHFLCRVTGLPCQNKKEIFYKYNPYAPSQFIPTDDGCFTYFCAHKLSYTAILDYSDDISFDEQGLFIKRYLQIHNYIFNFYSKTCKQFPFPTKKKEQKEWFKYWDGHPGRIDLFAYKDRQYYCLDAKVNTSKLSKWQVVRLAWMQQFGYFSGVIRIKFKVTDKDWLREQYENQAFEIIYNVLTPTITFEEFDLRQFSDKYQSEVPSKEKLMEYLKSGYHWFDPNATYHY